MSIGIIQFLSFGIDAGAKKTPSGICTELFSALGGGGGA